MPTVNVVKPSHSNQPASSAGQPQTRLLSLDILRGIAIMLVLGRHVPLDPRLSGYLLPISGWWARFGWTGVDLFFVLSGFLIGGLLFNELRTRGQLDVKRFLIRRGLKIYPPYLIYLAFVAVVLLYESHGQVRQVAWELLPNLLQVQNYLGTPRAHTWSLAVEEHFYLLLPFVLLLLIHRQRERVEAVPAIPVIALFLVIFCTAWRCYLSWHQHPFQGEHLIIFTHLRIDSLFCGVLLAYLYHFKTKELGAFVQQKSALLVWLGLALVCPMMILRLKTSPFVTGPGLFMLEIGYSLILLRIVFVPAGAGRIGLAMISPVGRALAFIGTYSYSIYLWHYEVSHHMVVFVQSGWLKHLRPELRWVCIIAVYVPLSLIIGILMARLVELPTLALRNRLFPAKAEALPPVSAQ